MPYGNKAAALRPHRRRVRARRRLRALPARPHRTRQNVPFISGTDCFGSPINEGYRKLVEAGEFDGTIEEYVQKNHDAQKATLDAYGISLSIYEGSGMGHSGDVHQLISGKFIEKLHENGICTSAPRCSSTTPRPAHVPERPPGDGPLPRAGLQVRARLRRRVRPGAPAAAPEDLIAPVVRPSPAPSPRCGPVENWYFDLPAFGDFLTRAAWPRAWRPTPSVRAGRDRRPSPSSWRRPSIYVKNDALARPTRPSPPSCPPHELREPAEGGKQSLRDRVRRHRRPGARSGAATRWAGGRPASSAPRRRSCPCRITPGTGHGRARSRRSTALEAAPRAALARIAVARPGLVHHGAINRPEHGPPRRAAWRDFWCVRRRS